MTVARVVTILYEDQRGTRQGFGLHTFVKACVFDAIDGDRAHVERALADCRPLKGAANVLRACREDIDLIAADGRSVVAVLDDDKIRHLLALPAKTGPAKVEQEVKKGIKSADRLSVVLIARNMESVLEAAGRCDPTLAKARVERAIRRKDLLERDAILTELARERYRPVRDCVLEAMPSLRALVDLLCKKVLAVRAHTRELPR